MEKEEIKKIENEIINLLKKYDLNYSIIIYILKDLEEIIGGKVYLK